MPTPKGPKFANAPDPGFIEGELAALIELRHGDPHSLLGPHAVPGGTVVRAYWPGARGVALIPDKDGIARPMERWRDSALFQLLVEAPKEGFSYRLAVQQPAGDQIIRDCYAFPPWLGELDIYLLGAQKEELPYHKLGAHPWVLEGTAGVGFALWAPNARAVSVVGDFNHWDGRRCLMRRLGGTGIWELFVPELAPEARYKFEIHTVAALPRMKTDPYAQAMELPPATASVVYQPAFHFADQDWMAARQGRDWLHQPVSIYEVHLGSWRRVVEEDNRPLSYRELAPALADYALDLGFTHLELLPVMEHPFSGSWGYQVSGYFAPTARYGPPDDFRYLVDYLHRRGLGVILDWVPAHFPKDDFSLGRFDGTALYEHLDPREGEHPDWGTYVFNYGRDEVRTFLIASALFWLRECHADGLRVDAVASMLYRDYGKASGQWIPNRYGGRENLEALEFLRQLNERAYGLNPGIAMIAEESTAWPGVSRPTYLGGLGFGLKWDMGWMNDTLDYFSRDPIYRRYYHRDLTFGLLYAWSENFVLPLSHDEVVHGKRSLLSKMPGDRWQQFANLRALLGYMWARPGKKLLFMGGEFGQWREWNHDQSLDWHLLAEPDHRGVQKLMRDLNRIYRAHPALWDADTEPDGFRWIDADNADANSIAFARFAPKSGEVVICMANFSPVPRNRYRLGLPKPGFYREILNTDSRWYGGGDIGNHGGVQAEEIPSHGFPYSAEFTLPPLAVVWLCPP